MKKFIGILLAVMILMSASLFAAAQGNKEFHFNNDGTFKILQLSDSQDDQNPAWDMQNFLKLAVEETKPDLIVFTGDFVEDSRIGDIGIDGESFREGVVVKKNGEKDHDKTLANLTVAADATLSVLQETGVPFAVAMGNNDYKCGISIDEWLEIFAKYSNCIIDDETGKDVGGQDFNIEIKNAQDKTVFNLWIMDTMRGGVSSEQVKWYKSEATALAGENGGEPVPAILYQHIYFDDIGNLFEKCYPWDEGAKGRANGGFGFYRLNYDMAKGYNTFSYFPCEPSEQFLAAKEQGDIIAAFFGHQHMDGFSGVLDGIELGISYGCEMAKPAPHGCRVITLHEDDLKNYDNEQFVYKGSVKLGNARLEKQTDREEYHEYNNPLVKLIMGFKNIIVAFAGFIINLFI